LLQEYGFLTKSVTVVLKPHILKNLNEFALAV